MMQPSEFWVRASGSRELFLALAGVLIIHSEIISNDGRTTSLAVVKISAFGS